MYESGLAKVGQYHEPSSVTGTIELEHDDQVESAG